MSPRGSGTTSTEGRRYARRRADMVERQLRRRGIEDERVLAAMARGAARALRAARPAPPGLPRRRSSHRRGADDLAALDRGVDGLAARARGPRARARGGHRLGLRAPRCCPAAPARSSRSSATRAWRRTRARTLRELGYDNVEVRRGRRLRGRPGAGALRRDLRDRDGRATTRRPPCSTSSPRVPRWCARSSRRGREHLMRFRDGVEEAIRRRALRPARERMSVKREFSAGGVIVRRFRGGAFAAAVVPREGVLALPKGHPDGDETMKEAAAREVREETGLTASWSRSSTTCATGTRCTGSACSRS